MHHLSLPVSEFSGGASDCDDYSLFMSPAGTSSSCESADEEDRVIKEIKTQGKWHSTLTCFNFSSVDKSCIVKDVFTSLPSVQTSYSDFSLHDYNSNLFIYVFRKNQYPRKKDFILKS